MGVESVTHGRWRDATPPDRCIVVPVEHTHGVPVGEGEQEWTEDRARFVVAQGRDGHAEDGLAATGPLAREFAELTRALLVSGTVGDVLARVVESVHRVVPGADLVSVTLREDDGHFHTPVETGPAASAIDQAQYRSGRGPCVESARAEGPALAVAADLRTDGRWPEFAAAAVEHGYLSVLATSLIPDIAPPRLPGAFTPADQDRMLLLSTHPSLALATCAAVSAAGLQEAQMRRAIESRDLIGQAKGILMARRA